MKYWLIYWLAILPNVWATDVTVIAVERAESALDLRRLVELARHRPGAEELENALADPDLELHWLDLDENGVLDKIRVHEDNDSDDRILVLTVEHRGQRIELVTLTVYHESGDRLGLDLESLAMLMRGVTDVETLERALNDPEVGINNLDLDHNQVVDYLRIRSKPGLIDSLLIFEVPHGLDGYREVARFEVRTSIIDSRAKLTGNPEFYGRGRVVKFGLGPSGESRLLKDLETYTSY